MTKNPLFSTYKQGENRVTSSMLAVFERIDVTLLEQILAAATGETSLQIVAFTNQPHGVGPTKPDARIRAHFAYWFEVKVVPKKLERIQLNGHLKSLKDSTANERLFVITPDAAEPPVIGELGDARVVWFNFRTVSDAIDSTLADVSLLPGERTVFLLRELQALFREEGLLDNDDTVVVAARDAYGEYRTHGVYVCQPGRSFRAGLTHLGFYFKGAIQREIPMIVKVYEDVMFTSSEAARYRSSADPADMTLGDAVQAMLDGGERDPETAHEVFVLTAHSDQQTLHLAQPIANATVGREGKPFAWTMGQRYTSVSALTRPGVATTADLAVRT